MSTTKTPKTLKLPFIGEMTASVSRTILGIVMGLVASGILIAISGVNPFVAYASMLRGAFGNIYSFTNVLVRVSPLLLGGMGVAIGIKAGVWNTGIEGYMYIGAIGAGMVAIPNLNLPPVLHVILALLAGMVCAAVWGAIPGYLRAYRGVNEVTATIMLNYIAIYFTNWMVSPPQFMADAEAFYPMSMPFQDSAMLPILMRGTSFHPGVFIGLAACIIFFLMLRYTPFGFGTRMLGGNPHAARYSGVDIKKRIVAVMMIGAMLGGLSGAIEVMGLKGRVFMEFVDGIGYESVAVALLAGGNPLGVIITAFFFAILKVGGATMSIDNGVSSSMTDIIIALCVLFVIGVGVGDAKIRKKKASKNTPAVAKTSKKEG